MELKDKVAFITGGVSVLGQATAENFDDERGATAGSRTTHWDDTIPQALR